MEHPWMAHLDDRVMKLKRTTSCLNKIYADPKLDCQLPRKGSVSGSVLKHAICSLERALATQGPLVFKIGYTHCPHFRFHNPVFGYACDPYQKWETMVAVFVSSEPTGPSFLEAALIQQYKGHLHFDIVLYLFFFWLGTENTFIHVHGYQSQPFLIYDMLWSLHMYIPALPCALGSEESQVAATSAMEVKQCRKLLKDHISPILCFNHSSVQAMLG